MKILLLTLLLSVVTITQATQAEPLPPSLGAAISAKILRYETTLANINPLHIWVFGDAQFATELRKNLGPTAAVFLNPSLDEAPPHGIIISGKSPQSDQLLKYSDKHDILIISNGLFLGKQSAAVVLADNEGVPEIFLNLTACKARKLRWRPELLDWVTAL